MSIPTSPESRPYLTVGDNLRTLTYTLFVDGQALDLTDATIVCHVRDVTEGTVISITNVTADPDQATYRGRCATVFETDDIVEGQHTLEWQVTKGSLIVTCPDNPDTRPLLTARAEAA